ncbi:MAG: haloacid dehalogenase-like hydrolase [Candidatus Magasanikbacteria bacterium]
MKLISNEQQLAEKIQKMAEGGSNKLHILSDFDKTITVVSYINGKPVGSLIGQLRVGGYLTPEYAPASFELFQKYAPFEHDQKISRPDRMKKMDEWWEEHSKLLIQCRLNKHDMDTVISAAHMKLRAGAETFFKLLHQYNVPIVIISGGPAYMIEKMLERDGLLTDNVHIVANYYDFDQAGYMIGAKKPIIHSLNKYEIILREFPFFEQLKDRTNVMLLGDAIDDLGMIEGFDYKNLLNIAFVHKEEDEQKFAQKFDVVFGGNDNFDFVNDILKQIL